MNEEMKAMRNLYWDECDQERQIERLRSEVINLSDKVNRLTHSIGQLMIHSHNQDGLATVPLIRDAGLDSPLRIPHTLRTGKEAK